MNLAHFWDIKSKTMKILHHFRMKRWRNGVKLMYIINLHWKSQVFLCNFQTIYRGTMKIVNRIFRVNFFVQNFTSFLTDTCIFAVTLLLLVKNAYKVPPLKINVFLIKDFNGSSLSAFVTTKAKIKAKMHGSVRKLVKFWTK